MIEGAEKSCFSRVIAAVADWYGMTLWDVGLKIRKKMFSNILEILLRLGLV